jgi:hypothetical protein
MFAKTTCFTKVRLCFITRKRKSLHYLMKCGGTRMAEARVPKVDTSGEIKVAGGGGCRLDGV